MTEAESRFPLCIQGSRRDTLSSETGSGTPLLGGILGAYPLGRFSSMSMPASLPSIGGDATATLTDRTFSLSFVLVVAIISFLLGSLLRSLLTRKSTVSDTTWTYVHDADKMAFLSSGRFHHPTLRHREPACRTHAHERID